MSDLGMYMQKTVEQIFEILNFEFLANFWSWKCDFRAEIFNNFAYNSYFIQQCGLKLGINVLGTYV